NTPAGMNYSAGGNVLLGAASNYAGSTTVGGSTVRLGVDNTLPTGTDLALNGGALDLNGHNQQVASLAGEATGVITNGAAATASTLTVNGANNTQYAGAIQDGAGTLSLVKAGAGALSLTGSSTYSGGTAVNNSTLAVGGLSTAGGTSPLGTGAVTLNGSTLKLQGVN